MTRDVDLAIFDQAFQRTIKENSKEGRVPDGEYNVVVTSADLRYSKQQGTPQLCWVLEIIAGEYKGCTLKRYNTISESDATLNLLDKDLKTCGFQIKKLSDLQSKGIMGELCNIRLSVRVVNKERGQNIYILERLDAGEKAQKKGDEASIDDSVDDVEKVIREE